MNEFEYKTRVTLIFINMLLLADGKTDSTGIQDRKRQADFLSRFLKSFQKLIDKNFFKNSTFAFSKSKFEIGEGYMFNSNLILDWN